MWLVLRPSLMVLSIRYPVLQKYLPFIMYCEAFLLFTRKVNCLQTFEQMSAYWAIKVYGFVKFHILGCL